MHTRTESTCRNESFHSVRVAAAALLLALPLLRSATGIVAAEPHLLGEPGAPSSSGNSSEPFGFTSLGDLVVFAARSSSSSQHDLWVTDGTSGGTRLLKAARDTEVTHLARLKDRVYFTCHPPSYEDVLWATDGDAAGTQPLVQLPAPVLGMTVVGHAAGDRLILLLQLRGDEWEWWVSDGTAEGSTPVSTVQVPPGAHVISLVTAGDRALATVYESQPPWDLISTNGAPGGTFHLSGLFELNEYARVTLGEKVILASRDPGHGKEPWVSDGTPDGTGLLKDLVPGPGSSSPRILGSTADRAFFATNDTVQGETLWVTDGTDAGTRIVTRLHAPVGGGVSAIDSRLFFWLIPQPDPRQDELWVTDGTPGGARLVWRDVDGRHRDWGWVLPATGELLFFLNEGPARTAGWLSNGTPEGTRQAFIGPSDCWSPYDVHPVGASVFMNVDDPRYGVEPWIWSEGMAQPVLLADLTGDHRAYQFVPAGSRAYFFDQYWADRLWVTHGSVVGTKQVFPGIDSCDGNGNIGSPTASRELLYFTTSDGLWVTDGLMSERLMGSSVLGGMDAELGTASTDDDGRFFFQAYDSLHGWELWVTQGSTETTRIVKDVSPGPGSGTEYSGAIATLGRQVLFMAQDNEHGWEPWVSDGTPEGSHLLLDIMPGQAGSYPTVLTVAGQRLFFVARELVGKDEVHSLWVSNGTTEGTVGVAGLHMPARYSDNVTSVGTEVVAIATDGERVGFWATNGTDEGTRFLAELPDPETLSIVRTLQVGQRAFFVLARSTGGPGPPSIESWLVDGTPGGARRVEHPAFQGPGIHQHLTCDGTWYFASTSKLYSLTGGFCSGFDRSDRWPGWRLWSTEDGSEETTGLVHEFSGVSLPGAGFGAAGFDWRVAAGSALWQEKGLFLFTGGPEGRQWEPWALPVDEPAPPLPRFFRGDANASGAADMADAIYTLSWLFTGGPAPGCLAAANPNGDAAVDISDATYLLSFLFLGGPAPVAPFPECGVATLDADEELGCAESQPSCP